MQQHELRPPRGAKKSRKRVGRGDGSGLGTYSGKGLKGQQSRSGYKTKPWFEGGQTPMVRRLPHRRGFRNPFRVEYLPVNLDDLSRLPAGSDVTPESLLEAGLTESVKQPVKILADGEVTAALTVKVHRVSASARAKIEAAGGTVEELTPRKDPSERRQRRKKTKAKAATPADEGGGDEAADEDDASEEPAAEAPADDVSQDDN